MTMFNSRDGLLLVISGPSGVGKGTVCKGLMQRNENIRMSVSATTRARRPSEREGVHYFYKTREEFKSMIDKGEFLEYTEVFGSNFYGTPRAFVEEQRRLGRDIILEIDVQGAMKVKEAEPEAALIFIAPPSMEELKTRLIHRGTENGDAVKRRLETAYEEIKVAGKYDYVVVNNVLDDAILGVEDIIGAERLRVIRNRELIAELEGGTDI